MATDPRPPSFGEAVRFWLKLGFISFGGPAGQIAIMHTELVEKKRWVDEPRFLNALNYCMLLPGPEATQLAIYCGWLLHRARGGLVAGVLFVLPSAVLLWGLSYLYAAHGRLPWIEAIFAGLKPAVVAIVAAAVWRIGQKALKGAVFWAIAFAAFVAIFWLKVPFPAIILGAAVCGLAGLRFWPEKFLNRTGPGAAETVGSREAAGTMRPTWGRAARIVALSCALWFAPVVAIAAWQGWDGMFARMGLFFSEAAMVTFGGAYAVLPYVAQQAVETHGWLTTPQMLDGLGLAETTPGPLIMVLQFVGFMGGWQHPGTLSPLLAATLGAALTTWVTFVPSFMFIFLGAPHLERLRGNRHASAALSAVTAAVVGVVLNLAVWFAWHVFRMQGGGWNGFAIAVALVAFLAQWRFKAGVVAIVLAGGLAGWLWSLAT
ncbi:MAG TPA: chromate efflux transporter [Opitutaceae bacterium]|nr:chromate efflux transporter [Opitutaceae bacterium]